MKEVRLLVKQGVKEFQVIAQDLTYYGLDLYKRHALPGTGGNASPIFREWNGSACIMVIRPISLMICSG